MALPVIQAPKFTMTLPTGEQVQYRPFTHKEQKNLLITAEGGGEQDVLQGIITLVDDCTFNKVDWSSLPAVDLEYAFIHIRAKSIGEVVEMRWQCHAKKDGKKCGHMNLVEADIRTAKAEPMPETTIKVTDDIAIVLDQVTPTDVIRMAGGASTEDILFEKVKMVVHGDEVTTEFTKEEFTPFVESFPAEASRAVDEFFKRQATMVLNVPVTCAKCGSQSELTIKGALNFFG